MAARADRRYAPAALSRARTTLSHVLVRAEHREGAYAARLLRRFGRQYLDALNLHGELSVTIVSDRAIRTINRKWRRKDKPTDVLSFPQDSAFAGHALLGDVIISLDTARRQATEQGHGLVDELARLLAHGLLHLLGYDHEREDDARRMAAAETSLLGRAGLVADALAPAAITRRTPARRSRSARVPVRKKIRRAATREARA